MLLTLSGLYQGHAALNVTNYEAAVKATPGLVSFYPLHSSANDTWGPNNGTLQGITSFTTGVGGGSDQALLVQGSGWVNIAGVPAFDFANGIGTVEMWVRPDWTADPGYSPCPFADRSATTTTYSFYLDGAGKANIGDWNGSTFVSEPFFPAALGTGSWHHLAVVFNAGTWTLYLDGVNCGTAAQGIGPAASAFQIGSWNYPGGGSQWIGALEGVAVYTNALTEAQIQAHHGAFFAAPAQPTVNIANYQATVQATPGLASFYPLEGNANDAWGPNSGSLQGTTWFTTGVAGGTDQALWVGGKGWVNVGAPNFDFVNGTGTVEMWLRPDWTSNPGYSPCPFADRSATTTTYSFYLSGSDKANIGDYNGSTFVSENFPGALSWGSWYHMAVVFNAGTWTLYLNGTNCGTATQGIGAAASAFQIGSWNYPNGGSQWIGALAQVAVYTNALLQSQVQAHYSSIFVAPPQIAGQVPSGTNVVAAGLPLQLSVSLAANSLVPHYQWYVNGGPITGATTNQLSFTSVAASNAATYICVITNVSGSVTSSPVVLQVGSFGSGITAYEAAVKAESSLISLYSFANFSVNDFVGTNNGTLVGDATFTTGIGGGPDKALYLPSGNGWVNLGAVPAFDFTNGEGTVELWLRGDWAGGSVGYGPCPFADRNSSSTTYSFYMDGVNRVNIGNYNGSDFQSLNFPAPLGQGVWHHIAVVFSSGGGGTWTLYEDGQAVGTVNQPLGALHSTFQIGSGFPDGNSPWIGAEQDVAIYSTALTPTQISTHYNAFINGSKPSITTQPAGNYLLAGQPFSLNVTALGAPTLHYQWNKNGNPVAFANMSSLNFASLVLTNAGTYTCVVTNSAGSITSSPAILQVGATVSAAVSNYDAAVASTAGLISFYKFDDLTPNDYVSGNNGTLQGQASFTPGFGSGPDQALLLEGVGWMNMGTVPAFDFSTNGTVELWLRSDWVAGIAPYSPTIFADRQDFNPNYALYMLSGKTGIQLYDGTQETTIGIPNAGTNWHHLVVVFTPGVWTLYWDGQNRGSATNSLSGAASTSQLGAWTPNGPSPWLGALDNVAYYSTSLTGSQVLAHFTTTLPGLAIASSGQNIILSWPLNGSYAVLQQESSLVGGVWTSVTNGVQVVNGTYQVNITPTGASEFYRLVVP